MQPSIRWAPTKVMFATIGLRECYWVAHWGVQNCKEMAGGIKTETSPVGWWRAETGRDVRVHGVCCMHFRMWEQFIDWPIAFIICSTTKVYWYMKTEQMQQDCNDYWVWSCKVRSTKFASTYLTMEGRPPGSAYLFPCTGRFSLLVRWLTKRTSRLDWY